jgi:hypothetical protein
MTTRKERTMLPGSILPPGLQVAASDSRKTFCENEEEYAQKYGRVVDRRQIMRQAGWKLRGRMIAIALLIGLMIHFMS